MEYKKYIKPLSTRKTRDGEWIIIANDSELIIVDECIAKTIFDAQNNSKLDDVELISILEDNKFLTEFPDYNLKLPEENKSFFWNILRTILFLIGIVSFIFVFVFFLNNSQTFFNINFHNKIFNNIIFIIFFLLSTTFFHEMMHILFSQNWLLKNRSIKLSLHKSISTVNMTYIWTWSLFGRLSALAAGIILDTSTLAILLLLKNHSDFQGLDIAIYILFLRILWQFRFHKNCDGKLIAMMLIDDPMIDLETRFKLKNKKTKNIVWLLFKSIGYFVEIILFLILIYTMMKITF